MINGGADGYSLFFSEIGGEIVVARFGLEKVQLHPGGDPLFVLSIVHKLDAGVTAHIVLGMKCLGKRCGAEQSCPNITVYITIPAEIQVAILKDGGVVYCTTV